jgi:hypothetical protein
MKHLQYISTIIIAAMTLSSCEKTIDVDTPPVEKRLALFSVGETGVPTFLYVKSTAAIKDRKYNPVLDITNATVILYRDDIPTDTMKNSGGFGYACATLMEAGKKYTIKVSAPNLPPVEASCTAPAPVPIVKVERTYNARKNMDGNYEDALVLTFNDPPQTGDCYMVRILPPQDSGLYNFGFCVYAPDASVETQAGEIAEAETCLDNDGIFLRDALFNGRQKELKLYVSAGTLSAQYNGTDSVYSNIELIHVPDAYFRYRQTRKVATNSDGNPFAEPANVFTNVTDGYGIFSIVSTARQEIR